MKSTMQAAEWFTLLTLSVLWGGSFFFVEVALAAFPPLTLVTMRVGFAALALWAFILWKGQKIPRDKSVWLAFLGMGLLCNVIPFSLIVWGQTEISAGLAAILNATTPLFAVIVAHMMLSDERASANKGIGVVIGFLGVIVMVGPEVLQGIGASFLAQVAVLVASVSYAFAGVFGRRFRNLAVSPLVTAAGQVSASALALLPISLYIDRPFATVSISGDMSGLAIWGSVLSLALFSTALAYALYFKLLSSVGATNISLVTFLIPVTANILGIGLLGEVLEAAHVYGMLLIGLGLVAIDGRSWPRVQKLWQKRTETPSLK